MKENGKEVWVIYEKGEMIGIHTNENSAKRHMKNRERIRHSSMEIKQHLLLPAPNEHVK